MRLPVARWAAWIVVLCGTLAEAASIVSVSVRSFDGGPVDTNDVLVHCQARPGMRYDPLLVRQDIRALEASGKFVRARAEADPVPQGVHLVYRVEPRPRLRDLIIEGADELGNHKVRQFMELNVGDRVDDAILAVQAQKIRDEYRKRYYPDARVSWTITPAAERGWVNVRIVVREGRRAFVKRIEFVGNRRVKARELIKAMKQRKANWLSWITGAGAYDPDLWEADRDALRKVYTDRGLLDATIGDPVIEPLGRRGLRIRIAIEEGETYTLGDVQITGVTSAAPEEVRALLKLKWGDPASTLAVENAANAIRDWLGSRGRIFGEVDYELIGDPQTRQADVRFRVREGVEGRIRNISIIGNSKTRDKVIRRELTVHPGEPYNESKIKTSERRLLNLNYFEYVRTFPSPTDEPGWYDLVINVEEKPTGQLVAGAGFSSIDRFLTYVEIGQGNFDLFNWPTFTGGGQKLNLRTQWGSRRTDYVLTFVEPWFLNRKLSLGVDLFRKESRYLSALYKQRSQGVSPSLGWPLTAFSRANLRYGWEQIDIYDVSTNASSIIRAEEGRYTKSSLTLELVRDTRDHPFVPTRGNRSSVSAEIAGGILGGETDIYGLQARSAQYFPLWFDHVFSIRGWAGVVDRYGDSDRVPLFDRLFLGGGRTIRGFKYRDVGPHDESGEPVGGQTAAYLSFEYTLPLVEKVRWAFFYDVGMVWEKPWDADFHHLNAGAGFGIRFDLPMFPIQLDYAWPVDTDPVNRRDRGRFNFWIGYVY